MQTRNESYKRFIKDLEDTQKTARLLVSGLEVPAEQILTYKQASERGVDIKLLVQQEGLKNKEMLRNWKKLGVSVRSISALEARVFIIDEKISYLLSYDVKIPNQAIGVRFAYAPIAFLMSELFEKRWARARKI